MNWLRRAWTSWPSYLTKGCKNSRMRPSSASCRIVPCAFPGKRKCVHIWRQMFNGAAFRLILEECTAIHKKVLRSRVFVALHMHAGDGNVHTNIPVNSDDYDMLQVAHTAVARIMVLARSLDGVISGEHGIGITKLEFLTEDEIKDFRDYKLRIGPGRPLQQGQAAQLAEFCRRPAQCVYAVVRPDGP